MTCPYCNTRVGLPSRTTREPGPETLLGEVGEVGLGTPTESDLKLPDIIPRGHDVWATASGFEWRPRRVVTRPVREKGSPYTASDLVEKLYLPMLTQDLETYHEGPVIRGFRSALGLTQQELADRIEEVTGYGISRSQIREVENGRSRLSLKAFQAVSRTLAGYAEELPGSSKTAIYLSQTRLPGHPGGLLTPSEAAKRIGRTRKAIDRAIARQTIEYIEIAGRRFITTEALERYKNYLDSPAAKPGRRPSPSPDKNKQ